MVFFYIPEFNIEINAAIIVRDLLPLIFDPCS